MARAFIDTVGVGASVWSWLAPSLIALVGVFVAGAFGLLQARKASAANAALERERQAREDRRQEREREEQRDAELERQRHAAEDARLHATTLEEQAAAYRLGLVAELRNVRILDMARPLDLHDLYVQVRLREDERSRYPRDEELVRAAAADPAELLERADRDLAERLEGSLAPEEALARHQRVVLLGDPGAGKTTLLRHLTLTWASRDVELPFYVELRRFVDSPCRSLIEFAASACADRYRFETAREVFERALEDGSAVLLLDGLDETLGGKTHDEAERAYQDVVAEIARLAASYPTLPIAVTCRRAGWEGGLEAFNVLELLDFAWTQVQRFLERWFVDDPRKAADLKATLLENVRMRSLAANPLLLSLVCMVYERELELPERRAELYSRCVEVLLREWDSRRGIKRFSRFTTDRKRDLLQELAWSFHRAGHRYVPEDELLEHIAAYLPTIDLPPEHSRAILAEVASQYGLLKEQAHGLYGFLHLTLQEYFAAVAAADRGERDIAYVAERARNPWWEEVAVLLAGRMSDASPLLVRILGHTRAEDVGDVAVARDDFLADRLLFAARCLVGAPRVRAPGLREAIQEAVRRRCEETPHGPEAMRAARVLAEIGDEESIDRVLAAVEAREPWIAQALLEGLGSACDAATGARLLQMATSENGLDEEVRTNALVASAAARAPGVEHELRRLMRQDDAAVVIAAMVAAGHMDDDALVDDVLEAMGRPWESFDQGEHPYSSDSHLGAGARALLRLGATVAALPLLALARSAASLVRPSMMEAVGRLGGPAIAPELAAAVRDPDSGMVARFAAVRGFVEARPEPELSLALAGDHAIPWQLRWLVISALERSLQAFTAELARICAEADVPEIEAAACATLASGGCADGLTTLREVATDERRWSVVAFGQVGMRFELHDELLRHVCGGLASLGDVSVVPELVRRFEAAIRSGDAARSAGLAYALAPFESEEPAALLLAQFSDGRLPPSLSRDRRLWSIVEAVVTPDSAVPLCSALATHVHQIPSYSDLDDAVARIVAISRTPNELITPVRTLLERTQGTSEGDGCYEALWVLHRRAMAMGA